MDPHLILEVLDTLERLVRLVVYGFLVVDREQLTAHDLLRGLMKFLFIYLFLIHNLKILEKITLFSQLISNKSCAGVDGSISRASNFRSERRKRHLTLRCVLKRDGLSVVDG